MCYQCTNARFLTKGLNEKRLKDKSTLYLMLAKQKQKRQHKSMIILL